MPNIYLKHPIHGTKIAIMEAEVEADAANGWKVYTPEEQVKAKPAKVVNQLAEDIEVDEVDEVDKVDVTGEAAKDAPPVEVKRRRTV